MVHEGPSTVDHRAIIKSLRSPNLRDFLVRTGMPELVADNLVDMALALGTNVFSLMRSTFISYGDPDTAFAHKLYEALHRSGVTTFFAPIHAKPGERLHRMMHNGINSHDRTILVCSRSSLDRKPVLSEIEKVLERETREGGEECLIPIRLDDYVFTGWKPSRADLADAVRARVVADFEGADKDEGKFSTGLRQLLAALRKTPELVPVPPKKTR